MKEPSRRKKEAARKRLSDAAISAFRDVNSNAYAPDVRDLLKRAGLRAGADLRNEKINYKVREHSVQKVPVILVVGQREMDERAVNVRRLGSQNQTPMSRDAVLAALKKEATPPDLKRD